MNKALIMTYFKEFIAFLYGIPVEVQVGEDGKWKLTDSTGNDWTIENIPTQFRIHPDWAANHTTNTDAFYVCDQY